MNWVLISPFLISIITALILYFIITRIIKYRYGEEDTTISIIIMLILFVCAMFISAIFYSMGDNNLRDNVNEQLKNKYSLVADFNQRPTNTKNCMTLGNRYNHKMIGPYICSGNGKTQDLFFKFNDCDQLEIYKQNQDGEYIMLTEN